MIPNLISAPMQNSASIVHVNLDISLFKCEAPPEFRPIGSALTQRRKDEAEHGKIHDIATKLGRLFNDIVPPTPTLIKAYGCRASEIMSNQAINPQGTDADGFFKDHIGADARSLWAAATSGPSAISMHLLGCMLAKAWSPAEATGLWFELVRERQKEIKATGGRGYMYREVVEASQQEIERSELAQWDSSMRAWLRRAEQTKRSQHCQFNLIAGNIKLPWTATGTTYQKVIQSWLRSMKTMEDLLNNLPQEATDRSLLHSIESWHLYPDLLVFQGTGTVLVHLNDPLLPSSAILSLGLEYTGQSKHETNSWSLALSHLRHYGSSVKVTSPRSQPRLTMSKVWLIALGNILRQWQVENSRIPDAVDWFRQLGSLLRRYPRAESKALTWLWRISDACHEVLGQDEPEKEHDLSVIKYGYRRATHFLDSNPMFTLPFFGLCNPHCMSAIKVTGDINRGVAYLREACSSVNMTGFNAAVCYKKPLVKGVTYHEWATVQSGPWQHHDGTEGNGHVRWIYYATKDGADSAKYSLQSLQNRKADIERLGEGCFIINDAKEQPSGEHLADNQHLTWKNPPFLFADGSGEARIDSVSQNSGNLDFQVWLKEKTTLPSSLSSSSTLSSWQSISIGLNDAQKTVGSIRASTCWLQSLTATKNLLDHLFSILQASNATSEFSWKKPTRQALALDLDNTITQANDQGYASYILMSNHNKPSTQYLASLRILELATHIYGQLHTATISPRIVTLKLNDALWIPAGLRACVDSGDGESVRYQSAEDWAVGLTRAQTFACIAMFESGRFNVDPGQLEEVVALGAEDSLFVAGILLSDPGSSDAASQVHHLIGNTGHSGMVLLVAPLEPMVRGTAYDPYSVKHRPFDGRRLDAFENSSLHLSFTEWKFPIEWQCTGEIDQELFLLESVLSVRQGGKRIGDIDVLQFERSPYIVFAPPDSCACKDKEHSVLGDVVSINSWDELLDPPGTPSIVHAHGNWPARLAVAALLSQLGKGHCIAIMKGGNVCWSCFREEFSVPEPHMPEFIID
ncbi:hypothetical protein PFICI_12034 [Pestalotiopsis fici W106-1]|uniref:Uncharacterized protein n=1 Tax=Pestalotiopsis fici (strain W106-1 / CGMCC3.15140) TaxID=1229662 RepID=W3WU13_PESFW|nr:uncharacterized protein PFICI_12034 [Pestalotiopsis fici W106-1]ETS76647.1 hypothetical protein PFICI_12034 [Pestalotiopsis fici W106-1]